MVLTYEDECRYIEAREKNRDWNMATSIDYRDLARTTPHPEHKSPRSPDTASPVYPERAIRPLPKSRLKSKLSPEQASNIVFPPEPPPLSPTLQFSSEEEARRVINGHAAPHMHYDSGRGGGYGGGHRESVHSHGHCTCEHGDVDSGDEEIEFDHPDYRYPAASSATPTPNLPNGSKTALDSVQRRLLEASRAGLKPPAPGSAGSSGDGYESFENTSNKKKRKIPLSSASSMGQGQLSAEIANMAISQADGIADDGPVMVQQPPYTPPAVTSGSGTGISGAGRGRYGRQNGYGRNGERRTLAGGTANGINGQGPRLPKAAGDAEDAHDLEHAGGIISQAIKSAAEQGPLGPQKNGNSKDGGSLLQSATASATSATPKTQFTFSWESESARKMEEQQAAAAAAAQAAYHHQASGGYGAGVSLPVRTAQPGAKGIGPQGAQIAPSLRPGAPATSAAGTRPPPSPSAPLPAGQQAPLAPAPAPKPKPRRRPSKEYALAARQRQLQQEYSNYHHPPTRDNIWICEFCEYEDIFGVPPVAMIRKYEIKDRQERKKAAERRRLLEKAKMKGRKGKKGKGKGNNSNAAANAPAAAANGVGGGQNYDLNLPPPEGDEYFDDDYEGDEYGDEYEPVDPNDAAGGGYYPPAVPVSTPAVQTPGAGPPTKQTVPPPA